MAQDQVEKHGLTRLLHHVLGPDFVATDYLQHVPHYEPLRSGKDLELAQLCTKVPLGNKTFPLVLEDKSDAVARIMSAAGEMEGSNTPLLLSEQEMGTLVHTVQLGNPPKQEKQQMSKKISLKPARGEGTKAKKIKLKIGSRGA